jgi:hypothetical protein
MMRRAMEFEKMQNETTQDQSKLSLKRNGSSTNTAKPARNKESVRIS